MTATILIVDDAPENIDLLIDALGPDYRIKVARNGAAALRIARSTTPPDLILLDILMPGLDGFEVCRRLQDGAKTRDIPIIFVTAQTEPAREAEGFALGAVDYIAKPISPPIVRARVGNHLKLKRNQEDLARKNAELEHAAQLREDMEMITRHDLKGPLNAIIAVPDILREELKPDSSMGPLLDLVSQAGYRMLDMINNSLSLYRIEQGTFQFEPVPVDLLAILRRLLAMRQLNQRAGNPIDQFLVAGRPPAPNETFTALGDEGLCHSLFGNLVQNAWEASPRGEGIAISLEHGPQTNMATVTICNRGEAPRQIRSRIFEKLATFGKSKGTGLGAYSARLMTEIQGGTIRLASPRRGETTIVVTLPTPLPSVETRSEGSKAEKTQPSTPPQENAP